MARTGIVFEQAISHSSWTLPAFVGLFSGRYPTARVFRGRLRTSLVERFQENGYATAAFTEGAYVSRQFGMDRGFADWWELEGETRLGGRRGGSSSHAGGVDRTFDRARAWLRENHQTPFFLLVHTYEVHGPYRRDRFARDLPAGSLEDHRGYYGVAEARRVHTGELPVADTEVAYVRALYDGGIAEADRHVGGLLEELESLGIADRTVVALTSDHGELLGDRRPEQLGLHGRYLYDALLHVPLLIRDPLESHPRSRVTAQVRLVDVVPTLLDLAGLAVPAETAGRSLLPLMRGTEVEDRLAYAELLFRQSRRLRRAAVRQAGWKLILNLPGTDDPTLELYHVARDPDERENLAGRREAMRTRLYGVLARERTARAQEGRARMGREGLPSTVQERLRALGYVE